jgi:hypothetical protein
MKTDVLVSKIQFSRATFCTGKCSTKIVTRNLTFPMISLGIKIAFKDINLGFFFQRSKTKKPLEN